MRMTAWLVSWCWCCWLLWMPSMQMVGGQDDETWSLRHVGSDSSQQSSPQQQQQQQEAAGVPATQDLSNADDSNNDFFDDDDEVVLMDHPATFRRRLNLTFSCHEFASLDPQTISTTLLQVNPQQQSATKASQEPSQTSSLNHDEDNSQPSEEAQTVVVQQLNDGYAFVALHFAKALLPKGFSLWLVTKSFHDDAVESQTDLSDLFSAEILYKNAFAPPIVAQRLQLELRRHDAPGVDMDATNQEVLGLSSSIMCGPSTASVDFGVVVDGYTYHPVQTAVRTDPNTEQVCFGDNTVDAYCLFSSEATRVNYWASRTVARLSIEKNGETFACTGFLLGAQSHLITNNHCIASDAEASSITVEFMAEGHSCDDSCKSWGACAGKVEAIAAKVVRTSVALDYTLLKLQTNVDLAKKYGFLRFRYTDPSEGDAIYIPQHPLFYGKRVSYLDDLDLPTVVTNVSGFGCNVKGITYNGDTDRGSSGSPVLSQRDHGVVALHHCGEFCANSGISARLIVDDLRAARKLPNNAVDYGDANDPNAKYLPAYDPTAQGNNGKPAELTLQLVLNGAITSSNDFTSVDQIAFSLAQDAELEIDVLSAEVSEDGVYEDLNHDCQANYADMLLYLFRDGNKKYLLMNDNAASGQGAKDGSISARDPYVHVQITAGDYLLALTAFPANGDGAFVGQIASDQDQPELYDCMTHTTKGLYRVQIAASQTLRFSKVPVNGTLPTTVCKKAANQICDPNV